MITNFKIFENESIPQIGDYVVCKCPSNAYIEELDNFLRKTPAKIIGTQEPFDFYKNYHLQYDETDIPEDLSMYFNHSKYLQTYGTTEEQLGPNTRATNLNLILFWAHNKKDLEIQLKGATFDL